MLGIAAIGGFSFVSSYITWRLIEATMGLRVSKKVEEIGQDVGELGIEAYPEFVVVPDEIFRDDD